MAKFQVCGAESFICSKSVLPNNWSTKDHDVNSYLKMPGMLFE